MVWLGYSARGICHRRLSPMDLMFIVSSFHFTLLIIIIISLAGPSRTFRFFSRRDRIRGEYRLRFGPSYCQSSFPSLFADKDMCDTIVQQGSSVSLVGSFWS